MIISLNWLKQYVDIDTDVDALVKNIGARLVEVEGVDYIGAKYKDVVVARVVECGPLENSDHLNVTKLDDGGVVADVERDENGLVQVVCGAPNVAAGMLIAWLPPKTVVPETFGGDDEFVLGAKPLRGVMSNGMIASPRELALYDEHEGILVVDKDVAPGASFAEVYDLDDYLIDIENKSLTHRPDTFGLIGFAREVAGIHGKQFTTPGWLVLQDSLEALSGHTEAPKVVIEEDELSQRTQVIVLEGVNQAAKSPVQMQSLLARSGVRPISAAVDIANYLMLLTGQPSHTYDYDKFLEVSGGVNELHVRAAREGETLVLLDGTKAELSEADIIIAAGETPVGLAGAMGGESTMVDDTTTRVLLEVATFDLYHLRSTQMRHGLFSEAITRFTKGVPAAIGTPTLREFVRLAAEHAGAKVASAVVDAYPGARESIVVETRVGSVNDILGTHFSAEDIVLVLENVGFSVAANDGLISVTVPYWREDIHIEEDVVEEVGRLVGFDTIAVTLPSRDSVAVMPSSFDEYRKAVRQQLVRLGANEVLTYSFVHGDTLKVAGEQPDNSYRIVNSISPELQYYRQSLVPSLLSKTQQNVRAGFAPFALFELNKVHRKEDGMTSENVPIERTHLGFTISSEKGQVAYYGAKRYLEQLAALFNVPLRFDRPEESDGLYEQLRSAVVYAGDVRIGVIGEFKASVRRAWKLSEQTAGFEIDLEALFGARQPAEYAPLSRYPGTERDLCVRLSSVLSYDYVVDAVENALAGLSLTTSVEPIDIYHAEDSDTKNITVRIHLESTERTLTGEEVGEVMKEVAAKVAEQTRGEII